MALPPTLFAYVSSPVGAKIRAITEFAKIPLTRITMRAMMLASAMKFAIIGFFGEKL